MNIGDTSSGIKNKIIIRYGEVTVKYHTYRNKFLYLNGGTYLTEYNDPGLYMVEY